MKMLKPFISSLLILTYSLGFAHNLIPHCHELLSETHSATHHRTSHIHNDVEMDAQNCKHIAHIDHFDKNLLDLIVCLFSELEHSSDILSFENSKNPTQNLFKDLAKIKTLAIVAAFFHLVNAVQQTPVLPKEQRLIYHAPLQHNTPTRGSPLLSC